MVESVPISVLKNEFNLSDSEISEIREISTYFLHPRATEELTQNLNNVASDDKEAWKQCRYETP